jgi:tetratricopeptide (TPR) repeat protein
MDAALRDFEQAHRLDPQLSFAQDAMGMLFSQKHDNAAALALFAQQSQLHPEDPLLQYLYAEALSQVENPDQKLTEKAIATAQRAVQLEPSYLREICCVFYCFATTISQASSPRPKKRPGAILMTKSRSIRSFSPNVS